MIKYRKKPVIIEASQLHLGNMEALTEQMLRDGYEVTPHPMYSMHAITGLLIETSEGTMIASIGDYIIKGVQGEYYPCKPDIFKKTYDMVEEDNDE